MSVRHTNCNWDKGNIVYLVKIILWVTRFVYDAYKLCNLLQRQLIANHINCNLKMVILLRLVIQHLIVLAGTCFLSGVISLHFALRNSTGTGLFASVSFGVAFNNPCVMGVLKPLKQAWFHFFFLEISFLKYVVFNNNIERNRVKKIQSSSSVLWTLGTWSSTSCHKEVAFHSLNHTIKRLLISSYFIKKNRQAGRLVYDIANRERATK